MMTQMRLDVRISWIAMALMKNPVRGGIPPKDRRLTFTVICSKELFSMDLLCSSVV